MQPVRLDHIVTSPLVRAAKTAEIIAAACSKPVSTDDGIIECDFGSLEGKSIRGAMAEHGITAMEELVSILPPDGEAWGSVSARTLYCVRKWLDHLPQANILFVCHDAVMQSLAEALCGRWFDNRHGTPFRFARTGDGWSVEEVGQPHRRPCESRGPITTGLGCYGRRRPPCLIESTTRYGSWVALRLPGTTIKADRYTPSPPAT